VKPKKWIVTIEVTDEPDTASNEPYYTRAAILEKFEGLELDSEFLTVIIEGAVEV
jgi:hypothetical protein